MIIVWVVLRTSSYYVSIFLRHFYKAAVAIKISNLLICFCSFELTCPKLEKYIFIENLYIVLSCLIILKSVLYKPCLFRPTDNVTLTTVVIGINYHSSPYHHAV